MMCLLNTGLGVLGLFNFGYIISDGTVDYFVRDFVIGNMEISLDLELILFTLIQLQ